MKVINIQKHVITRIITSTTLCCMELYIKES